MVLYIRQDVSGRTYKIILSSLPAVGDGLFHLWSGRSCTAFRFRLKWTAKKKNRQKSVKAPLWHKHKRNRPCIISLNFCLGVRQSPFLRLCGSRDTFVQNSFWAMVYRRTKPLLRKILCMRVKNQEIYFRTSCLIVIFAYDTLAH